MGSIAAALVGDSSAFTGQIFVPGSALGDMPAQLQDDSAAFVGTMSAGTNTGDIATTLDPTVAAVAGIFVESGGRIGSMDATVSATADFVGTMTAPALPGRNRRTGTQRRRRTLVKA